MSVGTKQVFAYLLTEEGTIILGIQAGCMEVYHALRLYQALLLL